MHLPHHSQSSVIDLDVDVRQDTSLRSAIDFAGACKHDVFGKVRSIASEAPEHIRPLIQYQLRGLERSKGYRPALLVACSQLAPAGLPYHEIITRSAILHLFHESCLLFDDLFDRAPMRRGRRTAHRVFGRVPTICAAVWAKEVGYSVYPHEPNVIQALHSCTTDLIDAEAFQWVARNAPRPLPIKDWERIARGSTGALFRLASALAGLQSDQEIIEAIAISYHGIDDLHDLLGIVGLGGGGNDDLRDRIPTLPSCFTSGVSRQQLESVVPECIGYIRTQLSASLSTRQLVFKPFFDEMNTLLSLVPHSPSMG